MTSTDQKHPELRPSTTTDVFWLFARRTHDDYPAHGEQGGKWLLFIPVNQIDDQWERIKAATALGQLGGSAKVSTARPNPNAASPETHVICVYTYDADDVEDVRRVRDELRGLGFTQKIAYKSDAATHAGAYQVTGHQRISRYYE